MNKILVTTLLFILTISPIYALFSDVTADYNYKEAIEYVQSQGIVNGYSDGTYRPDQSITRGEFTKIIINAVYGQGMTGSCMGTYAQGKVLFPDVPLDNTFVSYICLAKSSGIINGYSDGTYKVDNNITVGEASKIIAKAFQLINDTTIEIDQEHKFALYIEALANVNAIPTTIISIIQPLERGEMAEMIYRIKVGDNQNPTQDYSILSSTEYNLTLYCGRADFTAFYTGNDQWFLDTCVEPLTEKCEAMGGKFVTYLNNNYRCVKIVK